MEENHAYREDVLAFALDFGKKLLEAGYEVKKTQDTMVFICKNYDANDIEFFVIPSEIISTIRFKDGNCITQMREITKNDTNLYMIEKLNALSRKICSEDISLEQAKKMFDKTINMRPYPKIINSIGAGMGASGYCVYFGGHLSDAICVFAIAFLAFYIYNSLMNYISKISVSFIVSCMDGVIAIIMYKLGLCTNLDVILISSIMTIIPGMAFGNSVKDLLIGNTISGLLVLVNALLIAIAIASGFMLSLSILLKDYIMNETIASDAIIIISGGFASLGFAILYSVEPKKLPVICICGAIITSTMVITKNIFHVDSLYYTLFANVMASAVALCISETLARTLKAPTSVFLLPLLIPLVPGSLLYRTMISLLNSDYGKFNYYLKATILTAFGIAIGLVLFGIILQLIFYTIKIIKNFKKQITDKKR